MYIAPNTTVQILRGVPLDRGYSNTWLFDSANAQYAKFTNYTKPSVTATNGIMRPTENNSLTTTYSFVLTKHTYQRHTNNSIKVNIPADLLFDCNYLMFQNENYGQKWFYAFIDDVEYINNETSVIYYTIDYMQTYMFDFEIGDCFVEREHSQYDNVGDNLINEDFAITDYIIGIRRRFFYDNQNYSSIPSGASPWYFVIFYTPNTPIWESSPLIIVDGAPIGCAACFMPLGTNNTQQAWEDAEHALRSKLKEIQTDGGKINGIYLVPYKIANSTATKPPIPMSGGAASNFYDEFTITRPDRFKYSKNVGQEYSTIKNNKLYTYPFQKIIVSNNNGKQEEYRWEKFFNSQLQISNTATFHIWHGLIPTPFSHCCPINYNGVDNATFENGVDFTDFPMCTWSEDSFLTWWNQNKFGICFSLLAGGLSMGIGGGMYGIGSASLANANEAMDMFTGGYTSGGVPIAQSLGVNLNELRRDISKYSGQVAKGKGLIGGGAASIFNTIKNIGNAFNTRDEFHGSLQPMIAYIENHVGFNYYCMTITGEQAKIIDDYFTMYGYATKELKIPNVYRGSNYRRPKWNYLKCSEVDLHPNNSHNSIKLPHEASEAIKSILIKGITFWSPDTTIGDYSIANPAHSH